MKVFDNYEICPCTRTEEPDKPGHFYFEVCEPAEADVWTLYGHIPGEGVQAIGDFPSREDAEEVYYRIIGQAFGSHEENEARVRLMQAAEKLRDALGYLLEQTIEQDLKYGIALTEGEADARAKALTALSETSGRKIITSFVHPPIPDRSCDWQAVREGWEPGEPSGHGETEDQAVAALMLAEAQA